MHKDYKIHLITVTIYNTTVVESFKIVMKSCTNKLNML